MNRQPIPRRQIDVAEKQSTPRNLLRTKILFSPLDALSRALPPDREETVVLIPSSPVLTRHGTHPKPVRPPTSPVGWAIPGSSVAPGVPR